MSTAVAKRQAFYSAEQVERGLRVMALERGSSRHAAKRLAEMGHPIPYRTLQAWKTHTHSERYEEIVSEEMPRIYKRMSAELKAIAEQALDKQRELVNGVDPEKMTARERASAARDMATVSGIALDKAQPIDGRPSEIKATIDMTTALRRMAQLLPETKHSALYKTYVEGEANEIEPATHADG